MYNPITLESEVGRTTGWFDAGLLMNDEVTSARLTGIEIGMKEHEKLIQQQHLTLRSDAVKISEGIYSELKKKFEIKPYGMKIRTQGFSAFGTLYMLRADDFFSDKIEDIYRFLHAEQEKIAAINWSFVVIPVTSELNDSAITSDGYNLSYVEPA